MFKNIYSINKSTFASHVSRHHRYHTIRDLPAEMICNTDINVNRPSTNTGTEPSFDNCSFTELDLLDFEETDHVQTQTAEASESFIKKPCNVLS